MNPEMEKMIRPGLKRLDINDLTENTSDDITVEYEEHGNIKSVPEREDLV